MCHMPRTLVALENRGTEANDARLLAQVEGPVDDIALGNPSQIHGHAFDRKIRSPLIKDHAAIVDEGQHFSDGLARGNLAASRRQAETPEAD